MNTQATFAADVAVHVLLARTLDRAHTRVWAATSAYEQAGSSTHTLLDAIPDLTVLPLNLGRPLLGSKGIKRLVALASNAGAVVSLCYLAWLCRRERIDVIHVTDRPRDALFGLLLARLGGSACLIHAHTSYDRYVATRRRTWLLRQVDAVVGVSRFTANSYVQTAGLATKRVFAVHNAVDSTVFRPDVPAADRAAMRARLGVPDGVPLIGCVARLSRWKDQASLIDALALVRHHVPDARLVLAGLPVDVALDGPGTYQDYLNRRIAALGLCGAVTFAGFLPEREMPCFYAALDVLAHPAVEEPFGLALIEALASGRPVVAVRGGGIPEIIRDGMDGLLVTRERPQELACALGQVLQDSALARRLACSGRTRVTELFSPARQAIAMLDVYRHVVAGRSLRRAATVGELPHNVR